MTGQTTLTVSYTLSPPEGTNSPPSLAANNGHTFVVEADKTASSGEYYTALQKSIAAAREKLGEDLTAWRDAVGNGEVGKEKAAKAARADDDEEDDDDQGHSL